MVERRLGDRRHRVRHLRLQVLAQAGDDGEADRDWFPLGSGREAVRPLHAVTSQLDDVGQDEPERVQPVDGSRAVQSQDVDEFGIAQAVARGHRVVDERPYAVLDTFCSLLRGIDAVDA